MLKLVNQQSQYQMDQIRQQKFIPPQNSESLPTFRQVGNYLNSISSASTIFFERDNTHTRLESELKINSNKPSVDLQMASNIVVKNESNILSYSQSSSLLLLEDSLMHLHKLTLLFSSKDHLFNHISQSLAISGFNIDSSKSIAKLIANSFHQYTQAALRVDFKAIKEQMSSSSSKIANLSKQIVQAKQQNLKSFQKIVKLQNQIIKYRKKIVSVKQKARNPQAFVISNLFKQQYNSLMNKMINFETIILDKLINFQNGLINVTNFRNRLYMSQKTKQFDSRLMYKQNKRQVQIKNKVEREAMKELCQNYVQNNGQIQKLKKIVRDKDQQLLRVNNNLQNIVQQLNEQKSLYEQMLDKNIDLQKQIFLMNRPKVQQDQSESFCIIDQDHYIEQINQEIVQMGQRSYHSPFQ